MRASLLPLALGMWLGSALAHGEGAPLEPSTAPAGVASRPAASGFAANAEECYQQARRPAGNTAPCDGLIAIAETQTVPPALLASAYGNRGLMLGRRATTAGDGEGLSAALADLLTASQLAPGQVEPVLNQANLLVALGRLPEALGLYDKILAMPGPAAAAQRHVALFNRAIAYRALGDTERAQADFASARAAEAAVGANTPPFERLPVKPR